MCHLLALPIKISQMRIVSLVENTTNNENFKCAHGLSLYIETKKHKILFDLGPNSYFAENAKKLNINIEDVDIVIISHGHYDHGGGLQAFFSINSKAKVYIHDGFFNPHFSTSRGPEPRFIGIDKELENNGRFIYTNDITKIDEELTIFANPQTHDLISESNKTLLAQSPDGLIPDKFEHEHNLILTYDSKKILFCGCSHRGIVNILSAAEKCLNCEMDIVIGGFHLMNPSKKTVESDELLNKISEVLLERKSTKYYTCHCTGLDAYNSLHEKMKDRISYFSTSMSIEL